MFCEGLLTELFFASGRGGVKEGLHRRLSEAVAALMGARLVILRHPGVEVGLERLDAVVDLLAEGDPVELVLWNRSTMPLVCGLFVLVRL